MKKEINKDLLYEFIENSTRCILDEIKTDVIINGHIGSGAVINIYYFSNISDSLEKQSNFLSLYNVIEETRITIQRKNKKNFKENPERVVLTIPKNINISFKKCQGDISIENISGSIPLLFIKSDLFNLIFDFGLLIP